MLFFNLFYGPVAQLAERLDGIEEVVGSIPIRSTKMSSMEKIESTDKRPRLKLLREVARWSKEEERHYVAMGFDKKGLPEDQKLETREKVERVIDFILDPAKREQEKNENIYAMKAEIFIEWAEKNGVELPEQAKVKKQQQVAA